MLDTSEFARLIPAEDENIYEIKKLLLPQQIHSIASLENKTDLNLKAGSFNHTYAEVYTDASASPYGKGGACIGWIKKGTLEEVKFGLLESRFIAIQFLEAKAIAQAILRNSSSDTIHIHSDSKAGIKIIQAAINNTDHHAASNFLGSLIIDNLTRIASRKEVRFTWVKSHQDDDWNVLCDQLVRYGRNLLKEGYDIWEVNNEAKQLIKEMMRVRGLG